MGKCRCRGQKKKEKSGGWTSTAVAFYKTMTGGGACPCGVLCYMCTVKYRLWSGPVMAVIGAMLVRKPDPGSEGSSKSAVTTVDGPIMAVDGGIMAVMAVGDFCQYFQGKIRIFVLAVDGAIMAVANPVTVKTGCRYGGVKTSHRHNRRLWRLHTDCPSEAGPQYQHTTSITTPGEGLPPAAPRPLIPGRGGGFNFRFFFLKPPHRHCDRPAFRNPR